MFKRALSLIICFVMLISTLAGTGLTLSANEDAADIPTAEPTAVASKDEGVVTPDRATATYSGKCGDNLTWALDTSTGVLNITGTGKMTDYSSSSSVPWYSNRSYIKTIKIASSVTSIGDYAFSSCTFLKSVTIPDSVTSIGNRAFYYCYYLTSVTIGNSVTSIGNSAFYYCDSLTSVNIGNSVTSIGNHAFYSCDSLTSVTISDSVTSIGGAAFADCTSLTSVTIGNSVTSIGNSAFYYCTSLTSVTIGNSVTSIGGAAFADCTSLTSVTIGNSVTSIGSYAFEGCYSLTSVTIPDSVTSIGSYAFEGCDSLTSVTIPDSVTSIGEHVFSSCRSLKSVTIGNSVTSIGNHAFDWCTALTSVTIGNSVTSIGGYAFYECTSLTSVTIPDSVTSISYRAFSSCTSLTSVIIGKSVTSIGDHAFYECASLTNVYYGGGKTEWDSIDIDMYNDDLLKATITFIPKRVIVTKLPAKNTYYIGDSLNISGMELEITYDDNVTETITTGFTIGGFSSTTAGTKTLTVTYNGKTATFTVTVKTPAVTKIEEDKKTHTLKATTEPSGQAVTWRSNNTKVATVDKNGTYKLLEEGYAVITASFTYNGNTYSKTFNITVNPEVKYSAVAVSQKPSKTTYYIGDALNTSGMKLKLTYSNGKTETVTEGFTTDYSFVSAGNSTVTVEYMGLKTTFTVTVKIPTVVLPASSKNIGAGSSFSLKATTEPADRFVSYKSSDNNVATVSQNGRVSTYAVGKATITATLEYNGKTYTAQCVVNVTDAPAYNNPFTDVKDSHWFADSVLYCVQQGYVAGMTEDTFVPNGKLTRAQFLTILAKFDGVDLNTYKNRSASFTDVKTSHWFNNVVCWAVENGITSGISETKFGPNNNITRAQLARFFYVYSEKNGINTDARADLAEFPDAAKVASWAKTPLEWAVSAGLISGVTKNGANYLDPNGTATRAQAAVMFKAFDAFAGR